ncbi:agamous-like MADS-box protein AGL80 [Vicia villosa]|uniref:agamous-like MADS-box protein AGL80 n=1 Tax=Vicia villosa TaxID=3911 RepID=UPI00273B4390|nr:agamous-like MADS-box protein AGL80 [Vicia villosa]
MAAKNIEVDYITDDSKRNTTFRKRKQGIIKKMDEITTLCGIDACGIIYDENMSQPTIWPSKDTFQTLMDKFRTLPESEQRKVTLDHEDFLKNTIAKDREKLIKQTDIITKKNKMNNLLDHFIRTGEFDGNDLSESDLEDLSLLIDDNLKGLGQMTK